MVLVSNEWPNNKDDQQKPTAAAAAATATTAAAAAATTTTTAAAAAVAATGPGAAAVASAAVNTVTGSTGRAGDQLLTARPAGTGIASGVETLSKRQQRINKKALNKMELNKKAEQEQLQLREKHETETCEMTTERSNMNSLNSTINNSNSNNDANDNLENRENNNSTITDSCDSNTNTLQGQMVQQQVQLQLAINSAINATKTAATNNLFSSMGALQMPKETTGTVLNNSKESAGEARIVLQCEGKSHKFETRSIPLAPNQECKVGRLIAKSKASEGNAIFDCKVLSRNHAMLWYTADERFWVKDTKSSNGTFINDNKLGYDAAELHYGDVVKFGVEVIENSRQEVHGCIIARVILFLPDGREAISIRAEHLRMAAANRVSYDEIQRLNAFLQEASQREKMLKAKLSNLQGVLDSTRKNSAMCWQSMITEDQLLHKINLLEKKLQMMEKNVPENALRNEIVKLLEDKTTYQLTAKEALRKVYQDRCDAMQMLSKMELAYTTSDNECSVLRAQIMTSKQTLQDFSTRLEQIQLEYSEYKQETLRQQQEAKEQEEQRLGQLNEQLSIQETEMEQLRQQLMQLQKTIADHDSEEALQEQQALEHLNAAIGDDDDDDDDDEEDDDDDELDNDKDKVAGDKDKDEFEIGDTEPEQFEQLEPTPSKQKASKKSKRQKKEEFDLKNKVVRKDTMLKWLKNSDLNKGEEGSDVLKAIFNNADSGDEEDSQSGKTSPTGKQQESLASDEFIHKSPKHKLLNGIEESAEDLSPNSTHKLEAQPTLVDTDMPHEHAMDMLQEECEFYKKKSDSLTNNISDLELQVKQLKLQLHQQLTPNDTAEELPNDGLLPPSSPPPPPPLPPTSSPITDADADVDGEMSSSWREEQNIIKEEEREEELIVYKERLEKSEMSNLQLRNEIAQLRQKQPLGFDNPIYRRVLPLGCVALAAVIYFLTTRF